ncbi:MAG: putative phosphoribosyl transferase [Candidatus Anoxychlamydiales bacterium]|nr:putative phosphoribosyl transferase [Candidatus Anoxychlamydiales bacterium]
MLFKNREDAANKLSLALKKYKNDKDTIILALPRGGVVIGDIIAKKLNIPLDVIIPKKIISRSFEELAIGAICEETIYLNEQLIKDLNISDEYIQKELQKAKNDALKKNKLYRKNKGFLDLNDKTVLLVDDGIATGATIIAAIEAIKVKKAKRIIVASPLAPYPIVSILKAKVFEVICLYMPDTFFAIAQFYEKFDQVRDEEVINILK